MANMKVEVVSLVTTDSKETNLANYVKYIEDAAANGINLLVFPEYSSTGLNKENSMTAIIPAERTYFEQNAELIPEGETCTLLMEQAKKYNMYIAWTMLEQDPEKAGVLYNTATMVGPEGLVGTYRKFHRAGTEEYMFTAGDKFSDVFETRYGKFGFAICFDNIFPETARDLKLKGADFIVAPTAWPGVDKHLGELDPIMQLERYCKIARASQTGLPVISCNLGAAPDHYSMAWSGHATIIDSMGNRIVETTRWGEGKVVAELDPAAEAEKYYAAHTFTKEEHLKMIAKEQERLSKIKQIKDLIKTDVLFFGNAVVRTAFNLGEAYKYNYKYKK